MANLKNITDLPVAESAEGLNLIVNDNGAAKQIAAGAVGAQADWAETDENSPAFVKNKPEVAQADWGQNDSSAPDYVKNRTHYVEIGEKAILERQTVEFARDGGEYYAEIQGGILVAGDTVTVYWDGAEYECAVTLLKSGETCIETDLFTMNDNGFNNTDNPTWIYTSETATTHEIGITKVTETVHKLDAKYLPDYDAVIKVKEWYNDTDGTQGVTYTLESGSYESLANIINSGKPPKVLLYGNLYYGGEYPYVEVLNHGVVGPGQINLKRTFWWIGDNEYMYVHPDGTINSNWWSE